MNPIHRICGFVLALSLGACATPPPARVQTPSLTLDPALRAAHGQAVEVELTSGEKLRGVFVPPEQGEVLYLHFLAAPLVVRSRGGFELSADSNLLLRSFMDRGAGSLALDMRGVGASDGVCDPRNLPADALAAWEEALRRVDGERDRVHVRGISLGNLFALNLLEQGVDPGETTFIAPLGAQAASEEWTRAFGHVIAPRTSDEPSFRFDLGRIRASKHPNRLPVLFLGVPDDSMGALESAEIRSVAESLNVKCFPEERVARELAQAAREPLDIESSLFLPHRPRTPGFCALRRTDLDIIVVPQAVSDIRGRKP